MKHRFTKQESSKGGKNGSKEAKSAAGHIGFERTCELHPYFARKHLKNKIKKFNEQKGPENARDAREV